MTDIDQSNANSALPCVGCGEPVAHEDATVDRDGWWHADCAKKAWEACGYGMNGEMPAPFKNAWNEAKLLRTETPDARTAKMESLVGALKECRTLLDHSFGHSHEGFSSPTELNEDCIVCRAVRAADMALTTSG